MKLTVDLPPDLADAAAALADRDCRSIENLAVFALSRLLDADRTPVGPKVADAFNAFLTAPEKGERRPNTRKNYRKALAASGVDPDRPLSSIDRTEARALLDRFADGRRASTANLYVAAWSTVFRFQIAEGTVVGSNPFAGLRIRDETTQAERRLPFPDDVLAEVMRQLRETDHRRFVAALAQLHLGARSQEIHGLAPEDVYRDEESDLWLVAIRPNRYRRLKNAASTRTLPIPDALLANGFAEIDRTTWDRRAGKAINRTIRVATQDRRLVQHSFRHCAAAHHQREATPIPVVNRIFGWTRSDQDAAMFQRVYGAPLGPEVLKEHLDRVRFDALDGII
jgi:site-specific recombinase XerD